ncbi:MAG: winged helix-turn-helix transcriptional regulator [Hymenobacter sp.]|nr:MAG: winged helix-turn-helix transcriptional regulator [Hymenobacter sp.]
MIAECRAYQLPAPRFNFDGVDFTVSFFFDSAVYFHCQGVREDLIPIMLQVQTQGTTNNTAVQRLLGVSKPTASRYLAELEKNGYLGKTGSTGVGTEYTLKGS